MVDAHALGACGLGRAGSTPASPTRVGLWVLHYGQYFRLRSQNEPSTSTADLAPEREHGTGTWLT